MKKKIFLYWMVGFAVSSMAQTISLVVFQNQPEGVTGVYREKFSWYAADTVLTDGTELAGNYATWHQSVLGSATVIEADNALEFVLPGSGNNIYGFIAENSAISTPSVGKQAIRSVEISMQTVPLSTASAAGQMGVGLFSAGDIPASGGWGSVIGFAVQFGYVDGATKFMIRRRGNDGRIDAWNGSGWENTFNIGLSEYRLNQDYRIVSSIASDGIIKLSVYDGDRLVESASSNVSSIFSYPSGLTWVIGDFNSQNSDLPYEFTVNEFKQELHNQ